MVLSAYAKRSTECWSRNAAYYWKTLIDPSRQKRRMLQIKERPFFFVTRINMHFIKQLLAGVATLLLAGAAIAATTDIAGIKVEDSTTVGGVKLQLNGAGIRYKIFKIYVGELYTTKKISNLEELVAAPGPKRLSMTFLREVEAGPFGKLLTRGMEDNVPKNQMSKLVPGMIRMGDIFTVNKVLYPGDVITLDWIPGTGLIVTAKGKVQGEPFKEPEFFAALMSIWFGQNPGDWKLKDAMLGIK